LPYSPAKKKLVRTWWRSI